jgi:hypothetical protein
MSFANQDNIDDQPAYDGEIVLRAHALIVSRSQASRSFSRASPPSPTSAEGIRPDSRDQGDGHQMMVRNELPPSV